MWEVDEEFIRRSRPDVVACRDDIRNVRSAAAIEFAQADVCEMIGPGRSDRSGPRFEGAPCGGNVANMHVRVDKAGQQPVALQVDDASLLDRRFAVADAVNAAVGDGDRCVHQRRVGMAVDDIGVHDDDGPGRRVLRASLRCGGPRQPRHEKPMCQVRSDAHYRALHYALNALSSMLCRGLTKGKCGGWVRVRPVISR